MDMGYNYKTKYKITKWNKKTDWTTPLWPQLSNTPPSLVAYEHLEKKKVSIKIIDK